MRAVGSWLLALSAAGLLGSVLTAVAPEKNKKTVRFLTIFAPYSNILIPKQNSEMDWGILWGRPLF